MIQYSVIIHIHNILAIIYKYTCIENSICISYYIYLYKYKYAC